MENTTYGTAPQNSLMSSLESLSQKANMLEALRDLSERLIDKLERTSGHEKISKSNDNTEKHKNIIELFNDVDSRIERLLNETAKNIDKAIGMIE